MGVPKFVRYIGERYPCILELIKENQIPEFDNLYLDMNGILHTCSHPKNVPSFIPEEDIFNNIFHYIDILFYIIRPKKLLFMAVDGVAPRAKMNHQRSRRFRVAKEREMLEKKMISEGKQVPDSSFDSNCITPGTQFMVKLQSQLEYYVANRITTNPLWQRCKVILCGHKVPGEGEHKIVEYIRYMKGLPDYDPNLRHCIYGLDADLVMLGLCTHEKNISILREEVLFGRKSKNLSPGQMRFYLLHLYLLKEYLDLEFQHLKNTLPFEYDLDCIVDDWVLLGFILGNDFIPHLPDFHIAKGAFPVLYTAYTEVLPTLGGYLNEGGYLNLQRFQAFMDALAKYELKAFEETYVDLLYFAEKTGRKVNSEKGKENDKSKDPELEKLTKAVEDEFDFFDEDLVDASSDGDPEDEDDEDMFFQEFCQHKRDYYINKLEYSEVTDEVLRSQAEGYVRGLQWILHYYYHGCPSWSWFYPHHYAPCTSDIVNFKSVNLDFELGEPFLPYQQLLAVLPPASKDLLPKAYHELMTSPDSPLKEYYPSNFETDLNGKQHEWEAVVLLPIIDEGNLLKAMKECDGKLTPEEKRNNKHGPMLFYSYTTKNLGVYEAPQYFPNIESNHALVKAMSWDEIKSVATRVKMKSTKTDLDVYFPGFPTFKYIPFKASMQKANIKIFNCPSSGDSIVLTITREEQPETEILVPGLLDENVFITWPFLTEARVVAVAYADYIYFLSSKVLTKKEHSEIEKLEWSNKASYWRRQYMEKHGINIGEVKVLVYVKKLKGMIYTPDNAGKLSNVKVWSEGTELCPLQTIVKDIKVYEPAISIHSQENFFSVDSVVFTLSHMYYGAMGKIVKCMESSNRVKVEVEVPSDHYIDKELLNKYKSSYYSAYVAGQKLGVSQILVGRLSGNIIVDVSNSEEASDKKSTVNIGLGLKFNKYQEEIPGYTKKDNYWMYSTKAINIMSEYVKTYPQVISYLSSQPNEAYVFPRQEIFPDPGGAEEIQKLLDWINNLECSHIKRVSCGSQVLEKDVVLILEKMIDESPKKSSAKSIMTKTNQLFKSDLITNGLPPVLGAEHRLLDRVISVIPSHPVPLGLRGYIIGIHTADNLHEIMYDILYDTPFPAGMTLNCSPGRGFKTSETSFINISHGERLYKVSKPRTTYPKTVNSPRVLVRESQSSAFAQWNLNQSVQIPPDNKIPYEGMWSVLEEDMSQDGTKILKKMLKIEDDDKPKIEENVKNFFDTLSKNPEKFMPNLNNPVLMPKSWRSESQSNLLHQLKAKDLPPPKFELNESGKSKGQESGGLNERPDRNSTVEMSHTVYTTSDKDILEKRTGKSDIRTQNILESQARLQKSLYKECEESVARYSETVKSGVKSRGGNDKSSYRGNRQVQQNQRKNSVPKVLPTPPPQWCKQYRHSHVDQHRNCPIDEQKLRPDGGTEWDFSGRPRFQNENQNNWDRLRMDFQNNGRSTNWRQQDDRMRNVQSEIRSGKEFLPPPSYYGSQRLRPSQGEFQQTGRLRQDSHQFRQENVHPQAHQNNFQVGSNNSSQKLSAIAAEFIPLQALTRNRLRRPGPASAACVVGATLKREVQQDEAAAMPTSVRSTVQPKLDTISHKPRRKTKIAAKFDADWDLQG